MRHNPAFGKCSLPICAVLALFPFSLSAFTDPTPAPHYEVTDLNIIIRTSESGPHAINAAGEIVGTMDRLNGGHVAFLYRKGVITELMGLDGKESQATAINNKSQVAGKILFAYGKEVPVLWENGKARRVRPLPGIFGSPGEGLPVSITGINDQGQVIGSVSGWESTFASFVWQNGKIIEPPSFEVSGGSQNNKTADGKPSNTSVYLPATIRFLPLGINAIGQVVGHSNSGRAGGSYNHAMLWEKGKQQDLGTLSGEKNSRANAINDRGQVVGVSSTGLNTDHAFLWENGKMRDLGTLGGNSSEAFAINNKGQVVGVADIRYEEIEGNNHTYWGGDRAILWRNGNAYNLNTLIPKEAGWILERVFAINDRGQIVGIGRRSQDGGKTDLGEMRAFLLTPR